MNRSIPEARGEGVLDKPPRWGVEGPAPFLDISHITMAVSLIQLIGVWLHKVMLDRGIGIHCQCITPGDVAN